MRLFVRLEGLAVRASARLDRHPVIVLALLALLIGLPTVPMAAAKPLWHDEIYTVLLARLRAADLWTANLSGVDLSPPLNTLLTHVVISLAGDEPLLIRLPPLLGFALCVALVFEFARRRSTTVTALTAALLVCFTAAYRYSYEARGYGLMMGFAALSLFAWAEAAAGRRRYVYVPLLAAGLGASYWTHFYGLFAAAPVIAGELARTRWRRKIDAAVWIALAVSCLTLMPLIPLIDAGARLAPTFWGRAVLGDLFATYGFLLNSLVDPAFLAGAIVLVLGAIAHRLWFRKPHDEVVATGAARPRELPGHELTALAVGVGLPAIQIIAAIWTTGVFVPRYALLAIPALCIVTAFAMARLIGAAQVLVAAVLTLSFAVSAADRPAFPNQARQRPELMRLLARERPVLVTGGLMYLQLWYYTPPAMQDHLYYLAHPAAALERTGSDSIDRGLLGLAQWSGLKVVDPNAFVAAHSEFFVYGAGSGWLVGWLREDYAHIEQIGGEAGAAILLVRPVR
jgi:hypothetical protein